MKTNKVALIAVLLGGGLLAFSPGVRAQDQPKKEAPKADATADQPARGQRGQRGQRGGAQAMQKIVEDLGLTDEQKPKFREAMQAQREKMQALQQDQSVSREDRMAKVKEIREATYKKIEALLTTEQKEKWPKIREELDKQGPGNRRGARSQ
jgi:Spy/CpxP family protein refolding chaperone